MARTRRLVLVVALLMAALVVLLVASLAIGSRLIPTGTVMDALTNFDPGSDDQLVIRFSRLPRTLIGVLAGAALGLAGVLTQSLTRNALAEPGTLGVNAGAAVGVIIGLIATGGASIMVYVWFAFAGAALTSVLVHRLGRTGRSGVDPARLVLAGAALSIVLSALTRALILSADATVYESFRSWATGSLQGRGWESLPVVGTCLVVGLLISLALAGPLDSVSLGTDMATALGVNIRLTWTLANAAIVVLAGGATAACGPIAFIGLASPHIARAVSGPNHRLLLPVSALLAAVLLLLADVIGRIVVFPGEIGAGVMTALIGSPFFIHLVRRGRVVGI
ncbi:iron ABC transporter permease [Actinomyces massiliensis]|mgnify:FL=1|jgi:ABC-type Fe3+-siderophore transport system, permease component|uniref:FecCD family ABC transporter permease n=1 Tax=Actinomyces massiliensis TaxID=461393 RepID=UPI0028E7DDF0|nr:iron ABC transporter permease [Actinomyces massiliensis]